MKIPILFGLVGVTMLIQKLDPSFYANPIWYLGILAIIISTAYVAVTT